VNDLREYVWRRLGPRKFVAGRQMVNDLVDLTVENWEPDAIDNAKDAAELELVKTSILQSVKRMHQACGEYGNAEYGFIWVILIQALASLVVQLIVHWWFKSSSNRKAMMEWKQEMLK
jgi:hypothetical protein